MFARNLTLGLLASAAISMTGAANAADVYSPPPAAPDYVPAPVAWSGLYFGLHGGGVWITDVTADLSPDDTAVFKMTPGYRVGAALGYDFNSSFGIEAEASYAAFGTNFVTVSDSGGALEFEGPIDDTASVLTVMGNIIIGHQWGAFRPYIGFGAGAARVAVVVDDLLSGTNDSAWTWGAQGFIGGDFALSNNVSLGVRYRYQWIGPTNMSDGDGDPINVHPFGAQSLEATLKVRFGG